MLSDIETGAWLVFVGSVMSILMFLILSALHKFGFDDLLDKEEPEVSYVCLEAFGRHASKFFMFIGCFVGMQAAKDDGFWGSGCMGDFQETVDEEYKRFFDTLMVALFAMLYDVLYFVKESYFLDIEFTLPCLGSQEEKDEKDIEAQKTDEAPVETREYTVGTQGCPLEVQEPCE